MTDDNKCIRIAEEVFSGYFQQRVGLVVVRPQMVMTAGDIGYNLLMARSWKGGRKRVRESESERERVRE